jgi:hypothetical protein
LRIAIALAVAACGASRSHSPAPSAAPQEAAAVAAAPIARGAPFPALRSDPIAATIAMAPRATRTVGKCSVEGARRPHRSSSIGSS